MNSVLNFFYSILNNGYTKITSSLLVLLFIFMMLKIKPFRYFIPIVMIALAIYNIYTDYTALPSCIECNKASCNVLCSNDFGYLIPSILYLAFAIGFSIYEYLKKKYNKLDDKLTEEKNAKENITSTEVQTPIETPKIEEP